MKKTLQFEFQSKLIRVENVSSLLPPKTKEFLYIDDELVAAGPGSILEPQVAMNHDLVINGITHSIEARIGQGGFMKLIGIQLYIDGQFVAGDKTISYSDPAVQQAIVEKGPKIYFIKFTAFSVLGSLTLYLAATFDKGYFFRPDFIYFFSFAIVLWLIGLLGWLSANRKVNQMKKSNNAIQTDHPADDR